MEGWRAETEMVIYPLEFYRRSKRQWKHRVKASTPRPYASRAPDGHSAGIIAIKVGQSRVVEKIPKTKDEIQRLIIAELRTFAQCEKAHGESLSSQSSMTPVSRRGRSPVFIAASRMHMLAIGPCNALSRTTNGSTIWPKSISVFPWPLADRSSSINPVRPLCIAQYSD